MRVQSDDDDDDDESLSSTLMEGSKSQLIIHEVFHSQLQQSRALIFPQKTSTQNESCVFISVWREIESE